MSGTAAPSTGALELVRAAAASGVTTCFANPGTTEVPIVAALEELGTIRCVLALFEGVVTGAADGYARVSGRPAMTLTHLGPGFANGLANLHNARRARTPILNVIGQHATWHLGADSLLESDIEALARASSDWVRVGQSESTIATQVQESLSFLQRPAGGIATLIAPLDILNAGCAATDLRPIEPRPPRFDSAQVDAVAKALAAGPAAVLYVGGQALTTTNLRAVERIVAGTGCRVYTETFPAKIARGAGVPAYHGLPYFPERAARALTDTTSFISVGTKSPTSMFGSEGRSSLVPVDADQLTLASADDDVEGALSALSSLVGRAPEPRAARDQLEDATSAPMNAQTVGAAVAELLPDNSIVVDEAGTNGGGYVKAAGHSRSHLALGLTGGAIGMGLPVALGAAIAAPTRKVIALQADGSAMYTLQALWTMARERLDVTIVLLSNRRYAILEVELARAGLDSPGPLASSLTRLSDPAIDWVQLATSLGVPAVRPSTLGDFRRELSDSLAQPGPTLIEVSLA